MKLTKWLAAAVAVCVAGTLSWGAGMWQELPIIGGAAYCGSTIGVSPVQGTVTGQGVPAATYGQTSGNQICQNNVPAGPATLAGTEVLPIDLYTPGTNIMAGGPTTAVIPATSLANGYGTTQILTTTGTTTLVAPASNISNLIYAGSSTATWTTLDLPPLPVQNQEFCVRNAGSGVLTLGAVAVGTSGQSIVGVTPTSIPVATAVGTAGTVTLSANCWLYNVSNTSWYRVL